MGIYDRDYYRDESGRWGSASAHRGVIALIAITVALSLVNFVATEERAVTVNRETGEVVDPPVGKTGDTRDGDKPADKRPAKLVTMTTEVRVIEDVFRFDFNKVVNEFQVWRLFTSFLLTGDWLLGLLFGMLLLYFFGGEMEIVYGTGRFLAFYVLAGVLANVVKLPIGLAGGVTPTFGTSAPMFATLVLFAFHYPHRQIRIFFLLPVPVWLLVTIYLGLQVLLLLGALARNSIETLPFVVEPLVGAAVGFAYYRTRGQIFGFVDSLGGLFRRRRGQRRSPANLRVYDDNAPRPSQRATPSVPVADPEPVPQPAGRQVDEQLEAKLDAVLAKVARNGKGSLTAEENDILQRASEVFKKKRR